jgi:hypothetical protein
MFFLVMNNKVTYKLMFVDVTSKETSKNKTKYWTRAKQNQLAQDFACNCLWRLKVPIQEAIRQEMCWLVTLSTYYAHQPFVYSAKYCWRRITRPWMRTHLFLLSVFSVYISLFYSILRHFSFLFINSVFCCPFPNSTALVCLVVKPAVGPSGTFYR